MTSLKELYWSLNRADSSAEARMGEILQDFYARLARDTMVGFFFAGKDVADIARNQTQLVLKAMGAVEVYEGKSPSSAHLELPPIRGGHFDRRIEILRQTLMDHGLETSQVEAWLGFERSFREVVVG